MTDTPQKSRQGKNTDVSSVSVSKEFQALIQEHKFSPTEVFRRGMAVMLCDAGVKKYQSAINKERSGFAERFLLAMDQESKKKELIELFEVLNVAKTRLGEVLK